MFYRLHVSSVICLWAFFVPRSGYISKSKAWGKLWGNDMSTDKYCVIIFQILFTHFWKFWNIGQIFHNFGWGTFSHMMPLDQSRTSENIWWIITRNILAPHGSYWLLYLCMIFIWVWRDICFSDYMPLTINSWYNVHCRLYI